MIIVTVQTTHLHLCLRFISLLYFFHKNNSINSVLDVIGQLMHHWACEGVYIVSLLVVLRMLCCDDSLSSKARQSISPALLKQKENLASTIVHIKFFIMFALVVSQGFPKTTSNDQILSAVVCFGPKLWLLSKIWIWTGACCEARRGIVRWNGLAYWIPVLAWNMPGLTSAVERSRQKASEEWRLFLARHVKFSAWWFKQKPLSNICSVQWSCCQGNAREAGAPWNLL